MRRSFAVLTLSSAVIVAVACSSGTASVEDASDAGSSGDATTPRDGSSSGNDAASGGDASGDTAACKLISPYSTKDKPCNDCAEQNCCVEVNGCLGDTACNDDYVNCILACALLPDDAGPDATPDAGGCVADCGKQYPKGHAEYDVAIGCVEKRCPTTCK